MTEERFVKDAEYKELRPANAYDVAANESWLEDMAGLPPQRHDRLERHL